MDPGVLAEDLLFACGEWGLPVDVRRIARRLGLRVVEGRWSGLPQAVSVPGLRVVILNRQRPECARRFDLAHELWHFLYKEAPLDPPVNGGRIRPPFCPPVNGGRSRTPFFPPVNGGRIRPPFDPPVNGGRHGRDANVFACNLLMPLAAFEACWRETVGGVVRRDGQLDAVCARFAVSWTAARIRGGDLRLET